MLIAPARSAGKSAARSEMLAAPLGWFAREPISSMKPGQAIRLDNWVRHADGLHIRPGKVAYLTGADGAVQSLMVYAPRNGSPTLFSATTTSIYRDRQVVPMVTGLNAGLWSSDMQTNAAVDVLMACNGVDGVRLFNGSSWTTAEISGAPANLLKVCVHMRRPFFAQANSLRVWYLGTDAIQGPAHLLDLAPVCRRGGTIKALASMTTDGGRNTNDRLVIVTTQGEMIVCGGVDPTRAASWSLVGVFDVPVPVSERCLIPYGGDLAYLSAEGLLPASRLMALPDPEKPLVAFTDAIRKAYHAAVIEPEDAIASAVWGLVESTKHRITLINVPHKGGIVQFVRSADFGSSAKTRDLGWSRFTDLDATCWIEFDGDLYFGDSAGSVYLLDGYKDGTAPITAYAVEAYSRFNFAGQKSFQRVRPIFNGNTAVRARARMDMRVNYAVIPSELPAPTTNFANTLWSWSELTSWAQTPTSWIRGFEARTEGWRGISGNGYAGSMALAVKATEKVIYEGAEIMFQTGGQI